MCTRRRHEFCGSAALWPSTRPKPTVSGETTCSPSSHVGPHRLTWTFARLLCQGSGAEQAAESIDSFWVGRASPKKTPQSFSDAELQAQALKLPPTLRCLAQAACQHKTTKCKPEEYFKQWRSSAHCAKGASKERRQLLQSVGKAKANRKDFSSNLFRRSRKCQRVALGRRPQAATHEDRLAPPRSRHEIAEESLSSSHVPWQGEKPPPIARRNLMAALLSSPLMQVTNSFPRKVICEPMQTHGDAAQLAANAGNIFSSEKK